MESRVTPTTTIPATFSPPIKFLARSNKESTKPTISPRFYILPKEQMASSKGFKLKKF